MEGKLQVNLTVTCCWSFQMYAFVFIVASKVEFIMTSTHSFVLSLSQALECITEFVWGYAYVRACVCR